jgi:hypothetical protein
MNNNTNPYRKDIPSSKLTGNLDADEGIIYEERPLKVAREIRNCILEAPFKRRTQKRLLNLLKETPDDILLAALYIIYDTAITERNRTGYCGH